MKPIIVDMKDLSDSVEVYESKPNPFLVYTVYTILAVLVAACIWASIFKLDDVVKSDGLFKGSDSVYDISSGVSGKITECDVDDGAYVEEGDILYIVSIDSLSDTITSYQKDLGDAIDRLEILDGYEDALDKGRVVSKKYKNNQYYDEFVTRRKLLIENIKAGDSDTDNQTEIYQRNIDSIETAIGKYEEKIEKLGKVKACIASRNNKFDNSDSYYYSMVSSYISSYNYTRLQYENKISDYREQIKKIKKQIKNADKETDTESLDKQRETIENSVSETKTEKNQALLSAESSQIASVEQIIENYNENLISLNTNLESARLELENVGKSSSDSNIAILTEKGNISSERLSYEDKKDECENYLKSYNIQNDNCTIVAPVSGYFYCRQELKQGSFLQEGGSIGSIYPENESEFYAEIYVENSDIGKIEEGQKAKFEIAAFPSSEYGYFSGTVSNISKDITVDENTGSTYYVVRVKCDNMMLQNKDGDNVSLKNGMVCTGKIIICEKTVMTYLLQKINLID